MTHDTKPVVGVPWVDADGMKVEPVELMGVGGERGLYVKVDDGAVWWWSRVTWDQWAANAGKVTK
jgi:hypothetical protein